ncbi:protein kinase domain-containing protein [Granulicoccus sp. GXG6511]|uniref:protein kinase domain-containing protein n=1 Tax=Granulicoccus sp. GXG6511 TaxID=3381351 RepID=UPI003D7DB5FB
MNPDLLAGRYELTEKIAGGGMGQVWRGRDRVLERIVAIKTVDLTAQEPTARERFRREAIATAGLSAPNIVQVYDAGVDKTTAYLVMELLSGPTLARVIHDHGPMDIAEGLNVALEVARALLTAHKIGIVHRDIKPGNVMYHHDQVKLVDFGIAQLARNLGATLTAPATALGTAAYMSPEQAAGEGATDKSDWYALGCLMTTMFTGSPPFTGEPLAVANQQINGRPPFLSERRPEVPFALDRLVSELLAKEPADRPTGAQVVAQLRDLAADPFGRGTGDPDAATIMMAGSAGAGAVPDATVLYADGTSPLTGGTAAYGDSAPRRATFRESAWDTEPQAPAQPVAPARPPVRPVPPPPVVPDHDDRRVERRRRKSPVGGIIAVILLLLAIGVAGAYLLFGDNTAPQSPVPVTPSPAPTTTTQAPTTTRPATTRPVIPTTVPTVRRPSAAPTTTEAETTAPPTEAPTTDNPGGNGNDGNGDQGGNGNEGASGENAVQNAIANVGSRAIRPALTAAWTQAKVIGDAKTFEKFAEQLEDQGIISKSESKTLTRAVEAALDD